MPKTKKLTHFSADGSAVMVNIGTKPVTERIAVAEAYIQMSKDTLKLITEGKSKKGDVLAVARLAGIMAAKKTADLIPLCHNLNLSEVTVDFEIDRKKAAIRIEAKVRLSGQTGVEMEALTAASVTALTIYDMCKSADKSMVINDIRLLFKAGGKSGTYQLKDKA